MQEVNDICEVCDWKTNFGPEEIVDIICNIIEKNDVTENNIDLISDQELKNLVDKSKHSVKLPE
jgi:hypothetical protein